MVDTKWKCGRLKGSGFIQERRGGSVIDYVLRNEESRRGKMDDG